MKRWIALVTVISMLASPALAEPGVVVTDAQVEAIALPDAQHRLLLAQGFFAAPSAPSTFLTLGVKPGCAALNANIDALVAAYHDRWAANLVAAWRQAVPTDALEAAVQLTPEAAETALQPWRAATGAAMQARSDGLLAQSTMALLQRMEAAAAAIKPDSIDREARAGEVQAAIVDGSLSCGLMPLPVAVSEK